MHQPERASVHRRDATADLAQGDESPPANRVPYRSWPSAATG